MYIVIAKDGKFHDSTEVHVYGPFDTPEQARAWQTSINYESSVVDILIKPSWNADQRHTVALSSFVGATCGRLHTLSEQGLALSFPAPQP